MTKLAFHPDSRVCKNCDQIIHLNEEMTEGEILFCICGAKGFLNFFHCGKVDCNCGGFFSIAWENAEYPDYEYPR